MGVRFAIDGSVATITLDRPEARNAINGEVATGLEQAVDRLDDDPSVWVGVLAATTSGQERPVFCAGADLKEIAAGRGDQLYTERGGFAGFVRRQRRKPIVVAVDGLATAGGCEIVLAADMVVATTRSLFGLAEVTRGLVAAAGGLFRFPRAVGRAVAMDAILTGEPITAERAFELGMISRLVEPGAALAEATALARRVAQNAPLAVWESRRVVVAATSTGDAELEEASAAALAVVLRSEDLGEGLAAFVEKRSPRWRGR